MDPADDLAPALPVPGLDDVDCAPRHGRLRPFLVGAGLLALGFVLLLLAGRPAPGSAPQPVPADAGAAIRSAPAGRAAPPDAGPWDWPSDAWWRQIERTLARLETRHLPLPAPRSGEWLAEHRETGETFRQYLEHRPFRPTAAAHTLYVVALGELSPARQRVVDRTADYLQDYYGLPVKRLPALPLSVVPAKAFRARDRGERQIHSGTILAEVLAPRLPDDAAALIAFTAEDLFPAPSWNFVFGEASLHDGVGVWSLARLGYPDVNEVAFRRCLRRTLKIAAHEVGHMFGMLHCTAHYCVMNGVNSLVENDATPLLPCPQCLAKTCWLTGRAPRELLTRIEAITKAEGLDEDAKVAQRDLDALDE